MSQLFELMEKHLSNVQGYADDRQLYLSFQPSSSEGKHHAVCALSADVCAWLTSHKCKCTDSKTEFIIIGNR